MVERLRRYIPLQSVKIVIVVWHILIQVMSGWSGRKTGLAAVNNCVGSRA